MIYYLNIGLLIFEIIFFYNRSNVLKSDLEKKKNQDLFLFITYLQHTLIYVLRKIPQGKDLSVYAGIFEGYKSGIDASYLEPGFRIFNRFFASLGVSSHFFIAFLGAVTIFLYFKFIRDCSDDVYFSVTIFSFFMTYCFIFNGLRQALAMSIALQSIKPLLQKKYLQYFIIILIAFSFHYSAIFFLLMLPFSIFSFEIDLKTFFCILVFAVLMEVILKPLLGLTHYSYYLDSEFNATGSILNPALYVVLFFAISIFCPLERNDKTYFFYNMFAIAAIIYILSLQFHLINRMAYYFTPSAMILIPEICNGQRSLKSKKIMTMLFYVFLILYGISIVILNGNDILPYEWFWN